MVHPESPLVPQLGISNALTLVVTDVGTPPVHCQRHIYVYHFVYHQNHTNTPSLTQVGVGLPQGGGGSVF